MIDFVQISIKDKNSHNFKLSKIPNIYVHNHSSEHNQRGNLNNLKIYLNESILIIKGSLSKFYQGENCTPLTIEQVKEAVYILEESLGFNLAKSEITNLEIGVSLIVTEPVLAYSSLFHKKSKYTDHVIKGGETVYFIGGNKKFSIYDKGKKMLRSKKEEKMIPKLYRNKNVIRLELRFDQPLTILEAFGQALNPHDLYNPEICHKAQQRFLEFYKSIHKKGQTLLVRDEKKLTKNQINRILAAAYYSESNIPENFLKYSKEINKISLRTYREITNEYRKITSNNTFFDTSPLIQELDNAIDNILRLNQ